MTIGNAGGVDVTFNGKPLGELGRSGEVVSITLPRNSDRIEQELIY